MRRALLLLLSVLAPACLDPFALDDVANQASESSIDGSSSSDGGSTGAGETEATTETPGTSTGGEVGGSSEESGPEVSDSVGDPPPAWWFLLTEPNQVTTRGPLTISGYVEHAETVEVWVDGVSRGVFDAEGLFWFDVPIVYDGQDGEHTVEAIARSPVGEATMQASFSVDLPPGGQDVVTPWLDQPLASFDASFALARVGEEVVILGARDTGAGWTPLLRRLDVDNNYLFGWRLIDWTERWELQDAQVANFGMGMASASFFGGGFFLAMNLDNVAQSQEPRGYLAGLKPDPADDEIVVNVFPEVLFAEGEEIEAIAERFGVLVAVGHKKVAGGRTVAMAWGFNSETGESAWAPVKVDVPDWDASQEPRSARFNGVTFTNDGNILAVGSTRVKGQGDAIQTRALLTRLGPDGLLLGEPEIFGDQGFFVQTEALAVTPFSGLDGYCWAGWTRNGDFDPELMVAECRGETQLSRFSSEWINSAGLTIDYTPLTGRVIVGGYRNGLHDAVVISFEGTDVPFESSLAWTYAYDSPEGGLDRVTALACQTYECDVLIASDMIGKPQVRVSRINQ